jgi:hypothetical protein
MSINFFWEFTDAVFDIFCFVDFRKSTAKRSAIGTIREAELYGGLLSASLTREHLALTAEFLRGDE